MVRIPYGLVCLIYALNDECIRCVWYLSPLVTNVTYANNFVAIRVFSNGTAVFGLMGFLYSKYMIRVVVLVNPLLGHVLVFYKNPSLILLECFSILHGRLCSSLMS